MRTINIQDHVSAEASRGGARGSNVAVPIPNVPVYSGVRQILVQSGGAGAVGFMNVLAAVGQKAVTEQQALYDKMELSTALSDADKEFQTESDQWLQENVSGQGYTDWATNKYDEISKKYVDNASSSVRDNMKVIFLTRKNSIANSAFMQEKELYTGYALNQTQMQLNQTMNEVALHPEQADSLRIKFEQQLTNMQHILAGQKYEQYKQQQIQNFVYRQGQGTIDKRPNVADTLIRSEYYSQSLDPNRYASLLREAEHAKQHAEYIAKIKENADAVSEQRKAVAKFDELQLEMALGKIPSLNEILPDSTGFSTAQKTKLVKARNAAMKNQDKEIAVSNYFYSKMGMNDKVQQSEQQLAEEDIKPAEQEKFLCDYFKLQSAELAAEQKPSDISLSQQAMFMSQHSDVLRMPFQRLQNQCVTAIETAADGNSILDSCLAINLASDTPTFNTGTFKEMREFSGIAIKLYANDPDGALKFRDEWFAPQTAALARGAEDRWKQKLVDLKAGVGATSQEKKKAFLEDFYNKNDLFGEGGWYLWNHTFGTDPMTTGDAEILGDLVYNTYETVFKRTGSDVKAKLASVNLINSVVKKVGDEYIINPPTPQNTGLTEEQIQARIDKNIINTVPYNPELTLVKDLKGNYTPQVKLGKDDIKIKLECISSDLHTPVYRMYYLLDQKDTRSRNYLYDRYGNQKVIDFSQRKADGTV